MPDPDTCDDARADQAPPTSEATAPVTTTDVSATETIIKQAAPVKTTKPLLGGLLKTAAAMTSLKKPAAAPKETVMENNLAPQYHRT
ncbi:hypothetical protein G7Y89_g5045 [Cudoniella acicularis]|uniref:Uncharacterized protein n=1 Tax=Cudoniella acicularis TaxID=354080 RepID=A0A8H4W633_9HELO|nr:hypothetical protein G7Y89_g5045 [Cudoniella acicularis]